MTRGVAATGDRSAQQVANWTHDTTLGVDLPKGHIGPVLLSATGRTVWWTGRVAIGLRYEPTRHSEPYGESALWIQRVMLENTQKVHNAARAA